jgi:hypothetical protein
MKGETFPLVLSLLLWTACTRNNPDKVDPDNLVYSDIPYLHHYSLISYLTESVIASLSNK